MNSFVFIHMGGVEGGTTFILVILAVFVLICTHILSYLFFFRIQTLGSQYLVMYSSIFTRKNGTNPTKFRPRTSSTLAFVGGKKTQFLGFFRTYTKMFLLTRIAGLPKRGRQIKVDKSLNFGFESKFFHLRYTKRQYCV